MNKVQPEFTRSPCIPSCHISTFMKLIIHDACFIFLFCVTFTYEHTLSFNIPLIGNKILFYHFVGHLILPSVLDVCRSVVNSTMHTYISLVNRRNKTFQFFQKPSSTVSHFRT